MNKIFKIVSFFIFYFIFVINVFATDYPFEGTIIADALGVHSAKNYNASSEIIQLAYGTKVNVLSMSDSFYYIKYENIEGYVSKKYIINIRENILTSDKAGIETYQNYCNNLVNGGFHESYCPYLYYLHSIYPNWVFVADKVGVTLLEAANNEMWKSSLQTTNTNYWISNTPQEGDYYFVNASVVSSFLDPRNGLYSSTIFQFLDFADSKDIVNDSSLSYIVGNGLLAGYFNEFKTAGANYQVNPIHLISRSNQEGANKFTYRAVTGDFTTYVSSQPDYKYNKTARGNSLDGLYNFFNIGAWFANGYSAVGRGLAHAGGYLSDDKCYIVGEDGLEHYDANICGPLSFGRPWNTQAKAIAGGADFISTNYIRKGQMTNYYEKFNLSLNATNNKYTNQYMTNIYAPVSEGLAISGAYNKGNLMNSNFKFVIPVFEEMGNTGYEPSTKNTDSSLSHLKVNGKTITGFDKDVLEYNYNVITEENSISVEAVGSNSLSTVEGTGNYAFENGFVLVNVKVTAENGNVTIYKVNVKKVLPAQAVSVDDIINKLDVKRNDSYLYGISPGTVVSTLINSIMSKGGTAKVTDLNGVNKTNGVLATGDMITINGTSDSRRFTISIRGDISGDGLVKINDLILVQSHILSKSFLDGYKFYGADLNNDGFIKINDLVMIQSAILGKINL